MVDLILLSDIFLCKSLLIPNPRLARSASRTLRRVGAAGAFHLIGDEQGYMPTSRVRQEKGDTFIAGVIGVKEKLRNPVKESLELAVALATY